LGAASQELATIAVGADSSRYQRGPYVPLIITRFALGSILHAEDSVISCLLSNPSRSGTKKNVPDQDQQNNTASVTESAEATKNETTTCVDESTESPKNDTPTSDAESAEASNNEMSTSTSHGDVETKPNETSPVISHPSWKDNATLRASICTLMLQGGYSASTSNDNFVSISEELRLELNRDPELLSPVRLSPTSLADTETCPFFSMKDALLPIFNNEGVSWPEDEESLQDYIQSVLLPHCLKLCLTLAEEQTKIACDQGKTDVYLGRPSYAELCPLPDPFIPFEYHSEEAMSHAYAILRRAKLIESIRFIVGGGIPLKALTDFLRGPFWLGQAMGIPVW